VERRRNPRDGRSVLAAIRPEGERVARRASAVLNAEVFVAEALADPGGDLYAALKRLRRDLGDDV
jgi:DNA-binding MarR family transcriptional regulator